MYHTESSFDNNNYTNTYDHEYPQVNYQGDLQNPQYYEEYIPEPSYPPPANSGAHNRSYYWEDDYTSYYGGEHGSYVSDNNTYVFSETNSYIGDQNSYISDPAFYTSNFYSFFFI